MSRYDDILNRLRSATGPSDDIDKIVLEAFGWHIPRPGYQVDPEGRARNAPEEYFCPSFSIDAALALVEEKLQGWSWACGFHPFRREPDSDYPQGAAWCRLFPRRDQDRGTGIHDAYTAPLAILIALFEALKAEEEA